MFEKEEKELKNLYDNIQVPIELLDKAIFTGLEKAKAEEKQQQTRRRKWLVLSTTVAVILIGFFTSVRLSPAFAHYISAFPGMEKVIELIAADKGRMQAVENDYYQKVDVSQEKNGLKFTVDGVIADENGLVLFYTVSSKEKQTRFETGDVQLSSLDGGNLDLSSTLTGGVTYTDKGENSHSDMYEFYFKTPLKAKKLELKAFAKGNSQKEEFTLRFELNKELQPKKAYVINKTVEIEGQKILFEKAEVYPLRVAIHLKMDPKNTKKLLNFDDIRLVDEHGETWNKISNGITANPISADETIIYLQSNYFREPQELYLVLNKIQAVDKGEAFVVVDTKTQQIQKQPKGNHLRNLRIEGNELIFDLHTEKRFSAFPFSTIKDASGREIQSDHGFTREGDQKGITTFGVGIPQLEKQQNQLSLELSYYPIWIKGNEKVKIK
ncbi:DUF4179 domain-containing protein [Bacillus rubiinfantis]|uniref:DUF4179 domain-containing protein n=1 Tax=Bacillus rubiinfantis TaxID=1499680 RepID=UPI0005A67513|nr:DUF4179 domain-containing protein [Bacillus rubiinfantis]